MRSRELGIEASCSASAPEQLRVRADINGALVADGLAFVAQAWLALSARASFSRAPGDCPPERSLQHSGDHRCFGRDDLITGCRERSRLGAGLGTSTCLRLVPEARL